MLEIPPQMSKGSKNMSRRWDLTRNAANMEIYFPDRPKKPYQIEGRNVNQGQKISLVNLMAKIIQIREFDISIRHLVLPRTTI